MGKRLALSLLLLAAAGCGGADVRSAKSLRACVDDRLAPGAVALRQLPRRASAERRRVRAIARIEDSQEIAAHVRQTPHGSCDGRW